MGHMRRVATKDASWLWIKHMNPTGIVACHDDLPTHSVSEESYGGGDDKEFSFHGRVELAIIRRQ